MPGGLGEHILESESKWLTKSEALVAACRPGRGRASQLHSPAAGPVTIPLERRIDEYNKPVLSKFSPLSIFSELYLIIFSSPSF
jgi:hypothetical protein